MVLLGLESGLISGSCIATKSHTEVEGCDCKLRCVQGTNDHQNHFHLSDHSFYQEDIIPEQAASKDHFWIGGPSAAGVCINIF